MVRTVKSVDELRRTPLEVYAPMPWGPLTVTRHDDRVEVVTSDGRDAALSPVTYLGRHLVEDELRTGVDIGIDGRRVGAAVQRRHGWLRRDRILEFVAADDAPLPDGTQVRLRGVSGSAVMSTGDRTLIRPASPMAVQRRRRLVVADGVGIDAVLVYVAIEFGLAEALSL